MAIRITCISKDHGNHENRHCAISALGWVNEATGDTGTSTRQAVYDWIKTNGGVAVVRDGYGHEVRVGTAETDRGTQYVLTYRDGVWTDNLLALPEC